MSKRTRSAAVGAGVSVAPDGDGATASGVRAAERKKSGASQKKKLRADGEASEAAVGAVTAPQFWLLKSEPEPHIVKGVDVGSMSIDTMAAKGVARWDGIRNFQARNFIRDKFRVGDVAFFYHSSCKKVGIAGIVEVASAPYPDPGQYNPEGPFFDEKATTEEPRWYSVDLKFVRKLKRLITLEELRKHDALRDMKLLNVSRLSTQPVTQEEFDYICGLENKEPL